MSVEVRATVARMLLYFFRVDVVSYARANTRGRRMLTDNIAITDSSVQIAIISYGRGPGKILAEDGRSESRKGGREGETELHCGAVASFLWWRLCLGDGIGCWNSQLTREFAAFLWRHHRHSLSSALLPMNVSILEGRG